MINRIILLLIITLSVHNWVNAQLHLSNTYSVGLNYSNNILTKNIDGHNFGIDVAKNYQFSEFVIGFSASTNSIKDTRIKNNVLKSSVGLDEYLLKIGYNRYILSKQIHKTFGVAFWGKGMAFGGYEFYTPRFNDDAIKLDKEGGWLYGINLGIVTEFTLHKNYSILFEYGKNIHIDRLSGILKDNYSVGVRYYIFSY